MAWLKGDNLVLCRYTGEEKRVSVSGHTSRQVSVDMSHEVAMLQTTADNVFDGEDEG